MTTPRKAAEGTGHARYTYRLRVSSTARTALLAEWDRRRWIWNECVATSRQTHAHNRAHPDDKPTCGPAQLDRMLTGARAKLPWLRDGASVSQQQTIRDFGTSRSKAPKDIEKRLPIQQRASMPRVKKKREALPTLNYTTRGFRLKDGRLHLAGGIVLTVVWSRDLPAVPSSVRVYRDSLGHWYCSFVVAPEVQPIPEVGAVIGVDRGVKETATTTSDAHDLPHAQHGKTAAQKLGRYQRMMARRKSARGHAASKGYRQAQAQAAKLHKKVARQLLCQRSGGGSCTSTGPAVQIGDRF
jgi:putative transposase